MKYAVELYFDKAIEEKLNQLIQIGGRKNESEWKDN